MRLNGLSLGLWLFFEITITLPRVYSTENQRNTPLPPASAELRELTDIENPDDPYLIFRHPVYPKLAFERIQFSSSPTDDSRFDIQILAPATSDFQHLVLKNISLETLIPTAPKSVLPNQYLTFLSLVGQEWSRAQLTTRIFDSNFSKNNELKISRVDLVNNSLGAGNWELLLYAWFNDSTELVAYHGWFDFPKELYAQLFNRQNGLVYESFRPMLENKIDLPSLPVQLDLLREVDVEKEVGTMSRCNSFYPLQKEQKRRNELVIKPKRPARLLDLLTDSTVFSNFSKPGIYRKNERKATELGRFFQLQNTIARKTVGKNEGRSECVEFELTFFDSEDERQTRLVVGGIQTAQIPVLAESEFSLGWLGPMGIGNPVESMFSAAPTRPGLGNPYFSVLLDEQGSWLDNRRIGLEGTLLHWDRQGALHLWLVGFEREAFVGHYVLDLSGIEIRRTISPGESARIRRQQTMEAHRQTKGGR